MTINVRMALMLLVPLAGFLCFCFVGLASRHVEIAQFRSHQNYADVVTSLIDVASAIYGERSEQDSRTITATNQAVERLSLVMEHGPGNNYWGLRTEFEDLVSALQLLPLLRSGVHPEAYILYSSLAAKVVGPVRYLAYASADVRLVQAVDALTQSVALEDEIYREFDLGREIILNRQLGANALQAFNAAVTNQNRILMQLGNYGLAIDQSGTTALRERMVAQTIRRTTWLDLVAQLARMQQLETPVDGATDVLFAELRRIAPDGHVDLPMDTDRLLEIAADFPLVDGAVWQERSRNRLKQLSAVIVGQATNVVQEIAQRLDFAERMFWQYLALSVGAILVCALTMVLLGHPLVSRTRIIARDMATMRESGDYSATVTVGGHDEVADIATGFNHLIADRVAVDARESRLRAEMLKAEQQHSAELEARVVARTEELQQARQDAVAANEAKTRFLGNVSHHVRTPLNAILGFAQLLIRDPALGEEQRHKLSFIKAGGEELLLMMDDVLQMVRVETGGVNLSPAPLDLAATLSEIVAIFRQRAETRGIGFELKLESRLPEVVVIDEVALKRILGALLDNALKFTLSGEIRVSATLTGSNCLSIQIADSGIGMSTNVAQRMQGAFDQERVGCDATGGLGLGLSIATRLTEVMGGALSIESCPGRGTVVQVTFPEVATPIAKIA